MSIKRVQNKIAESRYTMPITAVYATVVCILGGMVENHWWLQFGCLAVSTFLMIGLNNTNALIRIYSRMVSCSFMVLCCATNLLFPSVEGGITELCFIAFLLSFFHAYQDKSATIWVFYAFLCLGLSSLLFVQILYFVPILWILLKFKIMAFSGKNFWASILGLIIPYWFVGGDYVYTGQYQEHLEHFLTIANLQPMCDLSLLSEHQIVSFSYVFILLLTGTIHFLRNSYKDKIRTRMLYEIFIIISLCDIAFLVLQPQHYDELMRILIICTSPLIGHFLALTRTKVTNIAFFAILLLSLLVTAYNLWVPSLIF